MSLVPNADRSSLRYVCAYLPRPGDRIRLEATFPDFASVTAETQVPQPPRFELLSAQRKDADDAGSDLEMTIRVIDDPSFDKYYFLLPKLVIADASYGEMTIPYRFSSSDIVFRNVAGGIFDVFNFGDDTDQVSYYFSDDLIRGETHTFMIRTRGVPPQEQESRFMLEMRTVTESLYWFDTSVASLRESLGGFLGEGVTIYSNVEGGYGVLCASSSASVEVEW